MIHPDILWDYAYWTCIQATFWCDSLAAYDMLAPIHPKHERADHWPEGWNPPVAFTRERSRFPVAEQGTDV